MSFKARSVAIKSPSILIVIPARGGSKRLPRKNVLPLAGKPLICWTIEAAIATGLDAQILVSSDDEEILSLASRYEQVIVHKRPYELATDTADTTQVLLEATESERKKGRKYQFLILLQPTSPLRTERDILSSYQIFVNCGAMNSVVTVCEVDHPTAWAGSVDEHGSFIGAQLGTKRSQDFAKEYRLNGAVYVANVDVLCESQSLFTENLFASIMPRDRSIDIDEKIDFLVCESLIEAR